MPNFVLGMNCKLYYGDSVLTETDPLNVTDGVTWAELTNAKDVNLNLEKGEADITTRANNGWRATAGTLKDGGIEFEAIWKPGDAGFTALQTAWANGTEISMMALDGAYGTAGSQGLAGNFTVTNFSRSEPLEEAATVSVTIKPSSYTSWFTAT